eukprot:UN25748
MLKKPVPIKGLKNTELLQAQESCILLFDMMNTNFAGVVSNQLIKEIVNSLKGRQGLIVSILNTTDNEILITNALSVNDMVLQMLMGYDSICAGKMMPYVEKKVKEGEASDVASNENGDLLNFDEDKPKPIIINEENTNKKTEDKKVSGDMLDDLLTSFKPAVEETQPKDPFSDEGKTPGQPGSDDPFAPASTKSQPVDIFSSAFQKENAKAADPFTSGGVDPFTANTKGDPFSTKVDTVPSNDPFTTNSNKPTDVFATTKNNDPFTATKGGDPFSQKVEVNNNSDIFIPHEPVNELTRQDLMNPNPPKKADPFDPFGSNNNKPSNTNVNNSDPFSTLTTKTTTSTKQDNNSTDPFGMFNNNTNTTKQTTNGSVNNLNNKMNNMDPFDFGQPSQSNGNPNILFGGNNNNSFGPAKTTVTSGHSVGNTVNPFESITNTNPTSTYNNSNNIMNNNQYMNNSNNNIMNNNMMSQPNNKPQDNPFVMFGNNNGGRNSAQSSAINTFANNSQYQKQTQFQNNMNNTFQNQYGHTTTKPTSFPQTNNKQFNSQPYNAFGPSNNNGWNTQPNPFDNINNTNTNNNNFFVNSNVMRNNNSNLMLNN